MTAVYEGLDLLEDFTRGVIAENPAHANFLCASRACMAMGSSDELRQYLTYCLSRGLSMPYLIDCYNTIVVDTLMEQIYFRKHKAYRCSTFKQVADRVYFDETYMKKYMYGLALTAFLWPNHAAMYNFFVSTFPVGIGGNYLEIGPGHGYYFRKAALLGRFDRMIGIDISAASVALTRDIVQHFGIKTRAHVEIVESDFLEINDEGADYSCIVMGEVLEHVEDPGLFLRKLAGLSRPDTHVYLTTCVNAPAIDHISLFHSAAEVEELSRANGLDVVERLYAPYAGKTLAQCEAERLAVNVAYVMRKL